MIELFKKKIKSNTNFSFIKFGDGEINCMRGVEGHNCDYHPYSTELGEKLKECLSYLSDKSYISDWYDNNPNIDENYSFWKNLIESENLKLNFVNHYILLVGWGNLENNNLFDFYQTIKLTKRFKIFFGPERLYGVKKMLNIDEHILVPLINAYSQYSSIISKLKYLPDNSIILMSVGLMSPVLAKDLLNKNPNLTILDAGNAFDPIFIGLTRHGGQASTEDARKYFKKLLN